VGSFTLPSPEKTEANVHILRDLYGADLVDPLVEIILSPEQVSFLERLEMRGHPAAHIRMSLIDPGMLAPEVEAALLEATVPGGPLDPAHLGGDVVWVAVIKTVLEVDVAGASKLARRLYARLVRISWDNTPGAVHPVTFSVVAYSVAFIEHLRDCPHEVRRWLREADGHTQHEYPPGLALLVYLRACRIWVGVAAKGGETSGITARLCLLGSRLWQEGAYLIRTDKACGKTPHPLERGPGAGRPWSGNFSPAALLPKEA
jgi:hypothetical protein